MPLTIGVAAGRAQHARQHAQRGGLAGAVGADQAEQLAASDVEAEPVHRGEIAEAARELLDANHGIAGGLGHDAGPFSSSTSTGMPGLSSIAASPVTRTLTAYTNFTRSSAVCTFLGVNSASLAMKVTSP